ncbi:recombinase RecT [Enterococcus faecium]|uniref:recombinase RecT n=1 Tax=Enterococcus faecium TaxID=1352 RepID=UPI002090D8B4|nr:RecT family recombinase [Enterococcus faecium]MCO5468934.1 recombinase RecT [Enterococcus faecium]
MSNETATLQKDITDVVLGKITELESQGVKLPNNYNAANALKQAFFKINEVALSRQEGGGLYMEKYGNTPVGKTSIANALLDMIQQGLNPGKNQCYFIAYGPKLQMSRSYFGTQAALKRLDEINDVKAEVIRKDDVFEIGSIDNETVVIKFVPSFENMDKEIIGAFATITKSDGSKVYTIMTKKQIEKSWSKAKTKNVQNDFPEEMAKRTVINRAAKPFINTSDDAELFSDAFNRTTENDYDYNCKDVTPQTEKVATLEEKLFSNKTVEPIQKETEEIVIPNDIQEENIRISDMPEHLEVEQAHSIEKETLNEPIQEELLDIPDFGREEGADDVSDFEDDEYPF